LAVVAARERDSVTRVAVARMAHQLDPQLVVADSAKRVDVAGEGAIVIDLKGPAILRECQYAFLGIGYVELEFAELEIEPRRLEQIVEPDPSVFEMEGPVGVKGRKH